MLSPLIALLFMTGALVMFIFFRFPPELARKSQVSVFNWMIIGVCTMLCMVWSLSVRQQLIGTSEQDWIRQWASLGVLAIINVFFSVGFVLRNFWIFKGPKTNWKQGGGLFD